MLMSIDIIIVLVLRGAEMTRRLLVYIGITVFVWYFWLKHICYTVIFASKAVHLFTGICWCNGSGDLVINRGIFT